MNKRIIKPLRFLLYIVLTALAALFSSFAFPGLLSEKGYGILIFLAYIPIFFIIDTSSYIANAFFGLEYGFLFYLIYNYWLKTFHPLAILIAPTLESIQYLVLFPLLKSAGSLTKKRGYIIQALLLTLYYYLTELGFLGYPYGNPSSALYLHPALLQSASCAGPWLIVLLIVIVGAMIGEMLSKKRFYKKDFIIYLIISIMNLSIGLFVVSYYEKKDGERVIRVAAVQHSADSWKGGYETYKKNFETLRSLSEEAMKENPEFVVWSETAFVPSVSWHKAYPSSRITSALVDSFVDFGKNLGVPLITGNPEGLINDNTLPAFLPDGSWNRKTYNTVILFGSGDILGTYRKQKLVPFTEHFPYEKQFPRLYELLLANDYKWWEEGEEMTVFEYDGVRFSTPICFEDMFGSLSADFVKNGADLLINLTNDSWSGSVEAEMQHLQLASLRAIETRRPLLRSTNSGITCLIKENGEIENMLTPFTECYGIYDIALGKEKGLTFYTKHPDLFPKLLIIIIPVLYIVFIRLKIKRKYEAIEQEKLEQYNMMFASLTEEVEC